MTSILVEYLQIYDKFHEQYGESTAVLMQVGHFFECYGVDNGKEKRGNAVELSKVLNIVLTRRSKKIAENSMSNPLMMGFPCLALQKYVPMLLENNYTIVIVEQVKDKNPFGLRAQGIGRVVSDIISPSTYIDADAWSEDYLAMVYMSKVGKDTHVGLSAMSVVTGKSVVYECYPLPDDKDVSMDDAICFLKKYKPREVVIAVTQNIDKNDAMSRLEINEDDVLCHHKDVNKIACNIEYQNAVLGTVFKNDTMLSNIEFVDLERSPCASIGYVLLIEFVHCHNPMLLKKISPPDVHCPSNQLTLATNTVDQLNVAPFRPSKSGGRKRSKDSLFSIINRCSTSMGKRNLLKRLLNPIVDVRELELRYDQIENFGKQDIESILDDIPDIEKLQRRMSIGIMTPEELAVLHASYESVLKLNSAIVSDESLDGVVLNVDEVSALNEFVDACNMVFVMENMAGYNLDNANVDVPLFKRDSFDEIDRLHDDKSKEMRKIVGCANELSSHVEIPNLGTKTALSCVLRAKADSGVKIEYTQNVGYYLSISNMRAKKLAPKVSR